MNATLLTSKKLVPICGIKTDAIRWKYGKCRLCCFWSSSHVSKRLRVKMSQLLMHCFWPFFNMSLASLPSSWNSGSKSQGEKNSLVNLAFLHLFCCLTQYFNFIFPIIMGQVLKTWHYSDKIRFSLFIEKVEYQCF